ncbi:MAG TPA: type II toxin-antitoxin system VapC family toxin [Acidobacteriaceae bacterium]|jgi:tRNA(fMet)-specific endonuclease VapC|nr:type II toxin-antitoxin system VapC family toxin [Acidobacteriaceae bacterium]
MIQTLMLDTNMCSYILRGTSPAARRKLTVLKENEIACISAITEGEIRYGLARRPSTALYAAIEGFLAKIQVLPWGRDEATVYGQLRAKQERAGRPLGNMDMLIAAHAISSEAVLVTRDRAFAHVEGLAGMVNWATDL